MAPMTPDELQKHPEFEHTIWKLKPTQKGKVAVAKNRGGPINIAYEVHGHGDRKIVVSTQTLSHSRRQVSEYYCCLMILLAAGSNFVSRFVSVALTVSALILVSHIVKSTFVTSVMLVGAISRSSYLTYCGYTCFYTFSDLLFTLMKRRLT